MDSSPDEQRAHLQAIFDRICAKHRLEHLDHVTPETVFRFGAELRQELEAIGAGWPQIEHLGLHAIEGFRCHRREEILVIAEAFALGFRVQLERLSVEEFGLRDVGLQM